MNARVLERQQTDMVCVGDCRLTQRSVELCPSQRCQFWLCGAGWVPSEGADTTKCWFLASITNRVLDVNAC